MTTELSREVRELYKMYGVNPQPDMAIKRIDLNHYNLSDEEAIAYLKDDVLPEIFIDPSLLDIQPATDDN